MIITGSFAVALSVKLNHLLRAVVCGMTSVHYPYLSSHSMDVLQGMLGLGALVAQELIPPALMVSCYGMFLTSASRLKRSARIHYHLFERLLVRFLPYFPLYLQISVNLDKGSDSFQRMIKCP